MNILFDSSLFLLLLLVVVVNDDNTQVSSRLSIFIYNNLYMDNNL